VGEIVVVAVVAAADVVAVVAERVGEE